MSKERKDTKTIGEWEEGGDRIVGPLDNMLRLFDPLVQHWVEDGDCTTTMKVESPRNSSAYPSL